MQPDRATGERRPVTVFFVDVVGSTTLAERMDPEDWATTMEGAMAIMVAAVERYDGWVASHTGDGFVAFFGIPVAHEDDPARAVSAGLEMLDGVGGFADRLRPDGIDFQIRVGINSGEVVIRETAATGATRDSRMYGDAVNVAARMQAEAPPGGILITGDTFARVAGGITTRHVGRITVKGKTEPVEAYEVLGRTGVLRQSRGLAGLISAMVGRDLELARLAALLGPVRAGLGRIAVVVGEPGIGKSRLLAELRKTDPSSDATWVEARTVSYGRNIPFHLVVDLVRSLVGLPESLESITAADASARLATAVADYADPEEPDVFPFLAHLLSLPLAETRGARFARMEPRTLRRGYSDALAALLVGAARKRPLVIICDDVHWADDASVELLEALLPTIRGNPILLILASRPDRDAPGWRLLATAADAGGDAALDVRLGPLEQDDGRRLVANLLEIESLPEGTRRAILERAEGNPLFMEEIVRMLIDQGAIVFRGGRWEATARVTEIQIPATLHGLLLARIDRLPAEARRILRVASVIGRTFPLSVLSRVTERP